MSQSPGSTSSGSDSESRYPAPSRQVPPEITTDDTSTSRGRSPRPKGSRHASTRSITTQAEEIYPPDDARAMSPRRGSEETEILEEATRCAVREQARQLQLSLLEIAESIELVKADHDKLEKQNLALQDYIGGLTRSMSKGQTPKGLKNSSARK